MAEKLFTQEEINRIVAGRLGRERDRLAREYENSLKRCMAASCLLCVAGYAAAVFAPWPLLSLAGCALCGFSVGILWPGTFSLSMVHCPEGGTAMFALFALAGDVGCALGPGVVGAVSGMAGGALKAGLLAACAFPVLLLLAVSRLRRRPKGEQ